MKFQLKKFLLLSFILLSFSNTTLSRETSSLYAQLDVSGFNEEQQAIIKEEVETYSTEINKLYETNKEEYKRRLNEFLIKIRDGFRIYRVARHPKVQEKIKKFDSYNTGIDVRVLTYSKDAWLNNLFYRLSMAYYTKIDKKDNIILDFAFDKSPTWTEEVPLVLPRPNVIYSENVRLRVEKRLAEKTLTASVSDVFDKEYNALSDEALNEDIAEYVGTTLEEFFIEGLEGVQDADNVTTIDATIPAKRPLKNGKLDNSATFVTPAGTPIKLPAGTTIADLWLDENLYPNGSLLAFITPDGKFYGAAITSTGHYGKFLGYYLIHPVTGRPTSCYPSEDLPSAGNKTVVWLDRYGVALVDRQKFVDGKLVEDKTKPCGIKIKQGEYSFKNAGFTCDDQHMVEYDLGALKNEKLIRDVAYEQPCSFEDIQDKDEPKATVNPVSIIIKDLVDKKALSKWISQQGGKATVWLSNCDDKNGQVAFFDKNNSTYSTLNPEEAKKKVDDGNFDTDIAIYGCFDTETGKWKITSNYKKGAIKVNPKLKGITPAKIEEISDDYVEKLVEKKSGEGVPGNTTRPGPKEPTSDGGNFKYDDLGLFEGVIAIKDFAKSISENVKVPEKMWNDKLPEYQTSPVNVPPMLAGAGDKGLEKITEVIDFIRFGLDLATEPEQAKKIWESIKELKAEDIKNMAAEMAKEELGTENYAKGGCHTSYQGGRHVIVVGMIVVGAVANFDKIVNAIENCGKNVKKKVDDIAKGAANIWDDIVIKGNRGVKEALPSKYKNIDEFLSSPDYASKLSSDFAKYKANGGTLDITKYSAKHKTLTNNRMQGNIAEDVFKDLEGGLKAEKAIQTFDGPRYIDNILNGTAREIKSGKLILTSDLKRQVMKDIDILVNKLSSDIKKVEWHALEGIDDNVLKFIKTEITKAGLSADVFKVVVY